MTYSILLIVKSLDEKASNTEIDLHDQCVRRLKSLARQYKDIQLLGEDSLLLPLDKGLQGVSDVVRAIKNYPYTYTVLTQETKLIEAVNTD